MKRVVKLIKNKGLINTFKKSSFRNFFQKKTFKKKSFFLVSFKKKLFLFKSNKVIFNRFIIFNGFFSFKENTKCKNNLLNLSVCLLKYMFIKSYKPLTSTLRFKKNPFFMKYKNIFKKLKFFSKNKAGRNNYGNITVFSKGVKNKTLSVITRLNTWDKKISCIFSIVENKKKIYSLHKHISGSLSVKPYIYGSFIGQKLFNSVLPQKYWNNNLPGNCVLLKFLSKYTIFSNLYVGGMAKYALSNGTFCQLIDYFGDFNLSKITLPSKQITYISGFNFVLLGSNSLPIKKYCVLGKAGVNKTYGIKPKVRGVARNPVDHPHGGRTKTNQPEVSIWGWVAKKNK